MQSPPASQTPLVIAFLAVLLIFLASLAPAFAQPEPKILRVQIEHKGPPTVSDELIRSHIRVKPGDTYASLSALAAATDEDIRSLYATGFFFEIRVGETNQPDGMVVTYAVQGNPRIISIQFQGNKEYPDSKLLKKMSTKVGDPLVERKLFTDEQEIIAMYQKGGYPHTKVEYKFNVEEPTGRAWVTFDIAESPKIKIVDVEFIGAQAFSQGTLRGLLKTRRHWMFSWITGHGFLKDEDLEDDRAALQEYYWDRGYIDFDLKEVQTVTPTARTMIVRFIINEGAQYKVGSVKFTGNKLFSTADFASKTNGLPMVAEMHSWRYKPGTNGLPMDVGSIFTPKGLGTNMTTIEDFYGWKGYIDVKAGSPNLRARRVPNVESGTMDLEFLIDEGKKYTVEKIDISGNYKTKDQVIRRELTIVPGDTFDMLRVKLSKERLMNMEYFSKVDTREEASPDVQGAKNLKVSVDEKETGRFNVGAGFSSIDALIGFAEVTQANFDLFHPPTFTGGGQRMTLRVQLGTQRKDFGVNFQEPWFLGRRLKLDVDLHYDELDYESLNDIYNEIRAGGRVGLSRALGSEHVIGSVFYGIEDVGILLNSGFYGPRAGNVTQLGPGGNGVGGVPSTLPGNVPNAILDEEGYHLLSRVGGGLAYDTRGGGLLPNHGQRTDATVQFIGGPLGGDKEFYKLELTTDWYFKGLLPGHILEIVGQTGVADSLRSGDVPFYERYYLGGRYTLRGFRYRSVSPRESGFTEPIGGDTYWFGSAEYSIPIIERLRFAVFYDIGNVGARPYDFNFDTLNDNWGIGLRLNLPIGPLQLDYGIPINHDKFNGTSGQFQFGVGWTRRF